MTRHFSQYSDPQALKLFDTYLSFIHHAQQPDGTVRNFMDFNRNWWDTEPQHDALGRTLWAYGTVMANPPFPRYLPIIKECFDRSVKHVSSLSMRGKAYAILGMADYLKQFPGASDIKRYFAEAADYLVDQYDEHSHEDWHRR